MDIMFDRIFIRSELEERFEANSLNLTSSWDFGRALFQVCLTTVNESADSVAIVAPSLLDKSWIKDITKQVNSFFCFLELK